MTTIATTNLYDPSANLNATRQFGSERSKTSFDGSTAENAGEHSAVIISLSPQAKTTLAAQSPEQKSFAQVATDARATINANYAALKSEGRPFDYRTSSAQDWDKVFGSLDRRSLYAVASNSGGAFSEDEQKVAQSYMSRQQGEAMMAADPLGTDVAARYKAGIAFLDSVSDEEKTSMNWAVQRAATQFGYEITMRQEGKTPDDLDSGNPLVNMIKAAMESVKDQAPRAIATGEYVKDLKDMPLFKDGYFLSQIDQAMQESVDRRNLIDITV
jgi:hypothetical protein